MVIEEVDSFKPFVKLSVAARVENWKCPHNAACAGRDHKLRAADAEHGRRDERQLQARSKGDW